MPRLETKDVPGGSFLFKPSGRWYRWRLEPIGATDIIVEVSTMHWFSPSHKREAHIFSRSTLGLQYADQGATIATIGLILRLLRRSSFPQRQDTIATWKGTSLKRTSSSDLQSNAAFGPYPHKSPLLPARDQHQLDYRTTPPCGSFEESAGARPRQARCAARLEVKKYVCVAQ